MSSLFFPLLVWYGLESNELCMIRHTHEGLLQLPLYVDFSETRCLQKIISRYDPLYCSSVFSSPLGHA